MTNALPLLLATRLDWGLGNPNKTAALIGVLMVGVWILPCVHRHLFWLALTFFTGLGICLIATASRGGLLATALGVGIMLCWVRKPWQPAYLIGSVLAVWTIVGMAVWLEATHRFTQGIGSEDKSISHRFELWRVAPRMMVDAPGGWGFGNSGAAYMQWYQPVDRTEGYRTLVNSHLTWLVELGWIGRLFYVLAWITVLRLCWPETSKPPKNTPYWITICLGVWVSLLVSAWFSSVAETPWLWVVPTAGLIATLVWRWRAKQWPGWRTWMAAALGSCAVLVIIFMLGVETSERIRLRYYDGRTVLGNIPDPNMWVVTSTEVLGQNYGRTLRQYLAAADRPRPASAISIGFVQRINKLQPPEVRAKILVVAGGHDNIQLAQLTTLAGNCSRLILLNPSFYPQDLKAYTQLSVKTEVITGEFSQVPISAWTEATKHSIQNVEGSGEFLPRWPRLVLSR